MHLVRQATHVSEYKLLVTFEDGSVRMADLGPYLDGEVFEPLRDVEYFRSASLSPDLDTVVWDNGADFSPDFLYEIGQPVSEPASAA